MELKQDADSGASYTQLGLFQPPTAHAALFEDALHSVVDKVGSLIPQFGLRNPRIGAPGSVKYQFCIPDEWVASFWTGQLWLAYSITGRAEFNIPNGMIMTWASCSHCPAWPTTG